MFIAPDLNSFKAQFTLPLKNMLNDGGLGTFILVLCNSMQDEALFNALKPDLKKSFTALTQSPPSNSPIDDKNVFLSIKQIGIEAFNCWETKKTEHWELVYNATRALRPSRSSGQLIEHIHQDFNPNTFHFNKPFLRPEILWEGHWGGASMRVLFNKFPFAPWHLLIAFEPEKQHPQYIHLDAHKTISALLKQNQHLSGFGIGYNSLGAFASINQLHFQGFIREDLLPIEHSHWRHNGGNKLYPLAVTRHHDPIKAWEHISRLHEDNQPYNLLYRLDSCYVIPQKGQAKPELSDWAQGVGWHEACGVMTLSEKEMMQELDDHTISQQLLQLKVE